MVKIRWLRAVLALVLVCVPLRVQAEENGEFRVEQVQTMLPSVHVYVSGEEAEKIPEMEGKLEERGLTLEGAEELGDGSIPTDFYFLVDCSTSTSPVQMDAVKRVLNRFAEGLSAEQTVTLVAFGTEVEILLRKETDQGVLAEGIGKLERDKKGTVFLDAIAKATELAGGKEEALHRKIAFVFSDSVEVNKGGYTREEISEVLSGGILPFYAFGFDTGTKEGLDQFGSVARQSGGTISIVSEVSLEQAFEETMGRIRQGKRLRFRTETNLITQGGVTLSLSGIEGVELQKKLRLRYWEPDLTVPVITEVRQTTDKTIEMMFSEPVQGAQVKENYSIRLGNGDLLAIQAVTYREEEQKAVLSLGTGAEIEAGGAEIEIVLTSVTDVSMEKNPVGGPTLLKLQEGEAGQEGQGDKKGESDAEKGAVSNGDEGNGINDSAAFFLLTIVSVAMIAGITVSVIKKRGGIVRYEGKLHFGNEVTVVEELIPEEQVKIHVVDPQMPVIRLFVSAEGRESKELRVPVNGAVFVGRSEICEVYFDDEGMSRQHFVIEQAEGGFLLTNLSKTNGTILNGVKINQPRMVSDGDQIEAGMYRFLIYFEGR